ncbi:MAG TPA: hypothetical protein VF596_09545 [Pyrinomonadaceae bacterium]|jgi:hypothetical protein
MNRKVKIIKRVERERSITAVSDSQANQSKNSDGKVSVTATVKSWVEDLRHKREAEAALFRKLFKEEYCS